MKKNFLYLVIIITGLLSTTSVVAQVIAYPPSDLEVCDDNNDGFAKFDLYHTVSQILNGQPHEDFYYSFYETLTDAINADNPLSYGSASNYNNTLNPQTIYARLQSIATGEFDTTNFDLIVHNSPETIPTPTPLEFCDDDNDGFGWFTLTDADEEITGGNPNVTVTYHITFVDAFNNGLALPSPYYNVVPFSEIIHVRVFNQDIDCFSIITIVLIVNNSPELINPTTLESCDITEIIGSNDELEPFNLESKTEEIRGGDDNISITYHETQADANTGDNALVSPYVNTVNPQTIYIRAVDINTNCIVSQGTTLDLVVNPLPSPITPTPLEVCDVDNDGFVEFDLTLKDEEIIGGEPGVVVSYYETYLDAEHGIFALTSPYINVITPTQIMFARAEYIAPDTGCYRVIALELIVNPTPVIPLEIDDLVACDFNQDGVEIFNLTDREDAIYGSQDPLDYNLNYFISQADAEVGVNAIANITAFPNTTNPQTIWIRLQDNDTSCLKIGNFDIRVVANPDPENPDPIMVCDVNNPGDGIEIFDLTIREAQILDGETWDLAYFEVYEDAVDNTGAIANPTAYTNVSNSQLIYVRVTIDFANPDSCFEIVVLELIVHYLPETITVTDYILLDENNDGFEDFDLTTKTPEILNGQTDIVVTFYEMQQDADADINAIANPTNYTNISNPQTIYTRLEDLESCYSVGSFVIIADPDLGVLQNLYKDLIIYPNPTQGILNVEVNGLIIEDIKIFNLQGMVLKNTSFNNEIDVSELASGIYFIQLSVVGKTITKKFIKN